MKNINVSEENYKIITELRHEWGLKHNNLVVETLLKGCLPDIKTSEEPETKSVDQAPEVSQEIDGENLRAEMKVRLEKPKREHKKNDILDDNVETVTDGFLLFGQCCSHVYAVFPTRFFT